MSNFLYKYHLEVVSIASVVSVSLIKTESLATPPVGGAWKHPPDCSYNFLTISSRMHVCMYV